MAKYAGIEAQRSLVLAAIALERHQHKHGSYPASLESLVPEFLAALPRDPMDGQPLRYRRKDDGTFTLYSVGWNSQDDGGDPTPVGTLSYWENGKDIVWPKPASQAEVDAFHDSMSSNSLRGRVPHRPRTQRRKCVSGSTSAMESNPQSRRRQIPRAGPSHDDQIEK